MEFELAVADVSVSACDKLAEALAKAGIRVLVEQAYIDNRQVKKMTCILLEKFVG